MSNRAERRARVKQRNKNTSGVRREELLRRRKQGGETNLVHGVCRECSRRRILIQPARLCERCLLLWQATAPTTEQQLAAIDEEFGEDPDEYGRSESLGHPPAGAEA